MNTEQAKKLSLPDLLAKLGHLPVQEKKNGYELWYRSPFRDEQAPSFHTSFLGGKWIWNDFGDKGGTVVDFAMRYKNYTSIKDALEFLDSLFQPSLFNAVPSRPQPSNRQPPFSFQQQPHRGAVENFLEDRQLELIEAKPIENPIIFSYLSEERGIPAPLARRYLQEVRYRNTATGKEYFAFGMPNQAGGYEIRVASSKYGFKSALKARDITIIPGNGSEPGTVQVFEGMTDFLSLLVMTGAEQLPADTIIMHSLSSFQRASDYIRSEGYQTIKTYLDNDKAGQQGTERFKANFGAMLLPQGEAFAPHHDLNDLLIAMRSKTNQLRK